MRNFSNGLKISKMLQGSPGIRKYVESSFALRQYALNKAKDTV